MSKRDRHNRFAERPDFREVRQNNTEHKAGFAPPKSNGVVFDPDEEEDASFFQKIGAFFGGCWEKFAGFSKSAVSKPWGWCRSAAQWTWRGIKTIPSTLVIRWDSEDDDELPNSSQKTEPVKAGAKPTSNPTGSKQEKKAVNVQYEEDDLVPSRWWNLGIKAASAAAATLILVGGYFAIQMLRSTPTDTSDTETVVLTDQILPGASQEKVADTKLPVAAAPKPVKEPVQNIPAVAATPTPPVASSFAPPPPPPKSEAALSEPKPELKPPMQSSQESLLANDPFFAPPPTPAVANNAPPMGATKIADDPVGATPNVPTAEQPVPVTAFAPPGLAPSANVPESSPPPTLTSLLPLAPLESVPMTSAASQLQPLVPLDSSMPPRTAVAAAPAPVAMESPVSAQVASNFRAKQSQRRGNSNNSSFNEAPNPPPVTSTISPTAAPQTIPITEPVREIVPRIPRSGTVQHVPPPVVSTPIVAEATPVRSTVSEPVPAIPKDAPIAVSPVIAVPIATQESTSQNLPIENLPIDRQLWDQVRELRGDTEPEPTKLRFDTTPATTEPALRFTPKQATSSVVEDNPLTREAMNSFQDLLPMDDLRPDSKDFAVVLPALENNVPQPVWAEIQPAYRDNQAEGEKGMTFQNRIDSAISRSPSETETYVVQQGDTYMTISDRFYGTSLLYTALAAHNQKLGIGWRPAEGMVVEIPTAEYLRMHYGEVTNRRERRLESQQSAIRYIVQEGDTIFRLATDKLQDSTRWREIYAINSDRIQDVRDLKPGMEILLPVATARRN